MRMTDFLVQTNKDMVLFIPQTSIAFNFIYEDVPPSMRTEDGFKTEKKNKKKIIKDLQNRDFVIKEATQ